jgi:hypothetical protein
LEETERYKPIKVLPLIKTALELPQKCAAVTVDKLDLSMLGTAGRLSRSPDSTLTLAGGDRELGCRQPIAELFHRADRLMSST